MGWLQGQEEHRSPGHFSHSRQLTGSPWHRAFSCSQPRVPPGTEAAGYSRQDHVGICRQVIHYTSVAMKLEEKRAGLLLAMCNLSLITLYGTWILLPRDLILCLTWSPDSSSVESAMWQVALLFSIGLPFILFCPKVKIMMSEPQRNLKATWSKFHWVVGTISLPVVVILQIISYFCSFVCFFWPAHLPTFYLY